MSSLTFIHRNDVFTNSLIIAENINYAHKDITAHIVKQSARFKKLGNYYVHSVKINSGAGRPATVYDLNEAQAVFLMTLLDNTNDIVLDFKMNLAQAFVEMKQMLLQKQTQEWQETRQLSKVVRLQETDAIKSLVDYATEQGSKNADKLYMSYSKLVKKLVGYEKRENASVEVLTQIIAFENILFGLIQDEMQLDTHYKEIYQKAKLQLTEMKRLWSMPRLSA